jgi:predicted Zn-dependent protease
MRARHPARTAAALLALFLTACGTLSVEEEKKLGAQYQTQLRQELTFVRDRVTVNYVREFGENLANSARPSPFEFRFYVVENDEINAFAIPGGAMYVHTGLLLAVKNGAELAAVLSHEMGHVTARHVANMYRRGQNTGFVANLFYLAIAILTGNPYIAQAGGLAGSIAGQAYLNVFTRDAEREADKLGVETMTNAGWNPNGMVTMFETLKKEYGSGSGPMFLSNHPATEERIENVKTEIKNYPDSDRLKLDDQKLPIIQERLKLVLGTDTEKVGHRKKKDGDDDSGGEEDDDN